MEIGGKNNMITYKKLKIKNEEEVEELNIDNIEELDAFGDIHFKNPDLVRGAIDYAYLPNILKYKVAKLSERRDWIIREYEGELYLIALKKDC